MNFKILKKDLKRKKSMNLILFLFVLLASMFISSSAYNLQASLNGTEHFFKIAGLKDYFLMSLVSDDPAAADKISSIRELLRNSKNVKSFTEDEYTFFAKSNLCFDDKRNLKIINTMIFSAFQINQQVFFDKDNQIIKSMEDGTIYVPASFLTDNGVKVGEEMSIVSDNGFQKRVTIVGYHKDALLGSEFMGSHRFLLSENDAAELLTDSGLPKGRLFTVASDDLDAFRAEFNNSDFSSVLVLNGDLSLIRSSYVMEMIMASVLLLVSICLILISAVMLRFLIIFTVNEDYKEIGIMKAIGIKNRSIRRLYLIKYIVLSVTGSVAGFLFSIPFSNLLTEQASQNLVLTGDDSSFLIPVLTSILTALLIIFFAYVATGKIKKMTPMDAIRRGNNGERFKRKGTLHLSHFRLRATSFLAGNDILCEMKKYFVVLIIGICGVWLIIMPANTINTLRSEKIAPWFSIQECDIWISDDMKLAELLVKKKKENVLTYIEETKQMLRSEGVPATGGFFELLVGTKINFHDKKIITTITQGLGSDTRDYIYLEGTAPILENELALATGTAKDISASVGDTVFLTIGNEDRPFLVTAIYQSMMNMGKGLRVPECTKLDYQAMSGCFGVQYKFEDGYTNEEKKAFIDKAKSLYQKEEVKTTKEFIGAMLGAIASRLDSLKYLIVAVVVAINILVVMLIQRMFFLRERGEIGMLKAVGFSNRVIITWQAKRILYVLIIGILFGCLTGTEFTRITVGPVFRMMGASKITFFTNPLEVYVLYPLIIILAVFLSCVLTMRRVRKISASEINDID